METVKPKFETGEAVMKHLGSQLFNDFTICDPTLRSIYEKTFWCFAGDDASYPFSKTGAQSATELGIEANKGMLLVGNTGVGKTTLFRIMARYFFGSIRQLTILGMGQLAEYLSHGKSGVSQVLNDYGRRVKNDLLIDDIDLSSEKDYRTTTIKDIIYQREELYTQTKGKHRTHLCFSFTADSPNPELLVRERLKEVYSAHIYSRMAGMCNLVLWQGKSFRPV